MVQEVLLQEHGQVPGVHLYSPVSRHLQGDQGGGNVLRGPKTLSGDLGCLGNNHRHTVCITTADVLRPSTRCVHFRMIRYKTFLSTIN